MSKYKNRAKQLISLGLDPTDINDIFIAPYTVQGGYYRICPKCFHEFQNWSHLYNGLPQFVDAKCQCYNKRNYPGFTTCCFCHTETKNRDWLTKKKPDNLDKIIRIYEDRDKRKDKRRKRR